MQEWNSFNRIEAAFKREIPDRVPKYEGSIEIKELNPSIDGQAPAGLLFFSPQMIQWFHRFPSIVSILKSLIRHPRLFDPIATIISRIVCKLQRKFNYDLFSYIPGIPIILSNRLFRDFHTEEKNHVIRDQKGRLVWRTSEDGAHARQGFMQSPADWDKYMELDADHPGNYFLVQATMKACKKMDIVPMFAIFGPVGFEELCSMYGFEKIFELLMEEKNFIKSVVREMNDHAIAVAENILQRGGKYIYFTGDLGIKGRTMISPRMFREFFKPAMKKACKRIHQLGGRVMFHSCGYVMNLIPDFIDAGIDALHPIEKTAGNDIFELKEKYRKELTLVGNVPIELLTHGTPKENYDYVKHLIENVSKDGGHIISSSHSVTPSCKLENFYAYYRAVEDHGRYPINIE